MLRHAGFACTVSQSLHNRGLVKQELLVECGTESATLSGPCLVDSRQLLWKAIILTEQCRFITELGVRCLFIFTLPTCEA